MLRSPGFSTLGEAIPEIRCVPFVPHIGGSYVKVLCELAFDGEVPLLRIRQLPVVELAIHAGILAVGVRKIEEGRRLVLSAGEIPD